MGKMKFSLLALAACVSLAIAGEKPPGPQQNPEKAANSVGSNNYCKYVISPLNDTRAHCAGGSGNGTD